MKAEDNRSRALGADPRIRNPLEEQERQLDALFAATPTGFALFDAAEPFRVRRHNAAYRNLLGDPYADRGVVGLSPRDYLPAAEAGVLLDILRDVARTGRPSSDEGPAAESFTGRSARRSWRLVPVMAEGRILALAHTIAETAHEGASRRALEREATERREAEAALAREREALRESEARFRRVFDAIDEGFCLCEMIVDREGRAVDYRFLETNRLFEEMTGLEGAAGRTALELVPDLEFRWVETYARVGLDRETLRFEQGSAAMGRWFDVFATPVEPEGRFAIVFRDVTARRRAEEALKESEARFRSMADHAPVMVWQADADGVCTYISRSWTAFTGQPQEAALDFGWLEMIHPDERPEAKQVFEEAAARRVGFRIDYRLRRADGSWAWATDSAQPRIGADGRFLGYIGSVLDITDRKRAEATLAESERRLARERAFLDAVIESAPVGISIARDPQGEPPSLNGEARRMLGASRLEGGLARYERLRALHPDGRRYEVDDYPTVRALKFGEEIREQEMIYEGGDERRRWLVNSRPIRDAAGRIDAAVTTILDVEERRRAEEHRQLLIDELNHRVKNTLAIVQAVVHQTLRRDADPERASTALQGRLAALAEAHDVLVREGWAQASLHTLIAKALASCGAEGRVDLAGPPVALPPKAAVTMTMAVHELSTNALKYGSLSTQEGRVSVEWRVPDASPEEPRRLRLTWRERGGPTVTPPASRGFGTRMVERALAAELRGEVRLVFEPEGLVCVIDAPLPETLG